MTEKVLGEIRDYGDYHGLCRARAAELELSREAIDRIAGLPSGYASKLLSPAPMKHFGPISFGPINGALGLKLVAVEDLDAMRAHAALRTANKAVRPARLSEATGSMTALRARIMRRNAQKACRARNEKLSPAERSQSAQNAALARWARLSPDERHRALRAANEARGAKRKRKKPKAAQVKMHCGAAG